MTAVPSPCTGVCVIDTSNGLCRGCARTLDEIAAWGGMSDGERRAVLPQLASRLLPSPALSRRPAFGSQKKRDPGSSPG